MKTNACLLVTGNFLTCPGQDPESGERHQAVIGNTLDHSAIRTGPTMLTRVSKLPLGSNVRLQMSISRGKIGNVC